MEIIIGALVIVILLAVIYSVSRKEREKVINPPEPPEQYDKEFRAFSIGKKLTDVKASMTFYNNGDVERNVLINGTENITVIDTWDKSDFLGEVLFELREYETGVKPVGPREGSLELEEPTWSLTPSYAGLVQSQFFVILTDGNTTKTFKISLGVEAADLRVLHDDI